MPTKPTTKSKGVMPIPKILQKFVNKHESFFCDQDGQLVLAQKANLPLKLWFFTRGGAILSHFVLPQLYDVLNIAAIISIGWWAIWEIVYGVCPWRRTLGLVVYSFNLIAVHSLITNL